MLQRFLYIVGILMFAVAGLVAAPHFLDLNKFKNNFSLTIKELTGLEPTIEGNVQVSFLPYPKLILGYINIPNKENSQAESLLSADGVEVNFTFASLIKGKCDPVSITLLRPHLQIEQTLAGENNLLGIIKNNGKIANHTALNLPRHIIIKNGTIIYQTAASKTSIDYISANINIYSPQGPFTFKGNFQQASTNINFLGNIGNLKKNSESIFNLTSDTFDFSMKGSYKPGDNFEMNGTTDLNIKNLGKLTDSFFNESPILRNIKSSEPLSMQGDFIISKEITSFKKLIISSNSIKGKGNIDILYSKKSSNALQWDIEFAMDKINTDALSTLQAEAKKDNNDNLIAYNADNSGISSYHFDLPTNISALLKLSLAELTYKGDKVTNLLIDTEIFNGKAIVHSVSAQMPGNSKIELKGNIDNNGIRPLFTGKIKSYGDSFRSVLTWLNPQYSFIPTNQLNEFLFSCDLNITPRIITISNIYGSVDRTLINGSILTHPSDTTPSINADLKIERFDFDSYNATGQINNYINTFISTAKDSNIDTSWLRIFNYKLALSLSGDDMVYNNNHIKSFSTSIGAAKGLFGIQNLNIDSDLVKLRGKIDVNLFREPPEIDVSLTSSYFNTAAFTFASPPTEKKENTQSAIDTSIWSKDPINLMGISRFNGKLDLTFDELKLQNTSFKNLILKGSLKKDIFKISECRSDFGEKGKISIKGSGGVSAEAPSIGISVLASAIEIKDILSAMKSNNSTNGTIYLGGVIKTFGISFYEWINELKANAKISTRNVEINNFNLPIIIEQSRKLYSVIDMNSVIKDATQSGVTKFMSIDGNLIADKSILQAKDFLMATDKSRGAFAGNISLHNLQMKGLAKIDYIPEYNKTVSLGVNLDGTLPDKLTYKLDKSSLEQYITGKGSK